MLSKQAVLKQIYDMFMDEEEYFIREKVLRSLLGSQPNSHLTVSQRQLLLTAENAEASTRRQKEVVLHDFLNKVGLQLERGLFGKSIGAMPASHQRPLASLDTQLKLLNLIKECHVSIHSNILKLTPEQLQYRLSQKISILLNTTSFANFSAEEKNSFSKQLLAIITHREDGRLLHLEQLHHNYTKSAQYLINYLSSNLRRFEYRLIEVKSRAQIRYELSEEYIKGLLKPNYPPPIITQQLYCGTLDDGNHRSFQQSILVITESERILAVIGGFYSEGAAADTHLLTFPYKTQNVAEGLNIRLSLPSAQTRAQIYTRNSIKDYTKILVNQDSVIHGEQFRQAIRYAVIMGKPLTVLINSTTQIGRAILNSRVGDKGFTDYFNVIDLNQAHQLALGTLDFSATIRHNRIYSVVDVGRHWSAIQQLIAGVANHFTNNLSQSNINQDATNPEELRTKIGTLITELSAPDLVTGNFAYQHSEAKELIDNFIKRCRAGRYDYLNDYQNINGESIDIRLPPPITTKRIKFLLPENYQSLEFYQKASQENKNAIDNMQHNRKIYYEDLPADLSYSLLIGENKLPYEEEEVISQDFRTENYSEDENVKIAELEQRVKQQISAIELVYQVALIRDEQLYYGSLNRERYQQKNLGVNGVYLNQSLYDGKLMLHNRYYDRDQMLLLLKAIKSGDEDLFVVAIANIITSLPLEKLAEQRNALFNCFTRLFVSGKFPNKGMKLQYHHFMGRCGHIH